MQRKGHSLLYSPSDLITFMGDSFSSWMDRNYLESPSKFQPDENDESSALIQKRGILHEQEVLCAMQTDGKNVFVLEGNDDAAYEKTIEMMHAGKDVIYQGFLRKEPFAGLSDFLVRVPGNSKLGDFHYEVWDSKLAKKPKPYFLVQLCCYSEMLEEIQGRLPEFIAVVLGSKEIKKFRTLDFYFFYQSLKERFLKFQNQFDASRQPDWVQVGDNSRWKSHAEKILEERDDLIRVANIRKSQIRKLKEAGINTLSELARIEEESDVPGMAHNTLETLSEQAWLQLCSKDLERPLFEVILRTGSVLTENGALSNLDSPIELGDIPDPKGLYALPRRSKLDIFFDMEGFPLVEGGLEYLFGATTIESDKYLFHDWWAHDRQEEKRAFENFIDWSYARWQQDDDMHIFHYGAYEISALRRLASRHASRESELDEMLRAEKFVDLYSIVRNGVRIGCESYSIKKVEQLYMQKRKGEVAKATDSIVYYERWLESPDGNTPEDSSILKDIRDYNQIDCESTAQLYDWLLKQQLKYSIRYSKLGTKSGAATKKAPTRNEILSTKIKEAIPEDRSAAPEHWRVMELMADLTGFHNRERKVGWWELYDRAEMSDDELFADPECVAFVQLSPKPPVPHKKSLLFEYSFDQNQDLKLKPGDTVVFTSDTREQAEIFELDESAGSIVLKRGETKAHLPEEGHLILKETMNNEVLEDSIANQAESFYEGKGLKSCIEHLLFRRYPSIKGITPGTPVVENENKLFPTIEAMDNTYLCIQGPPGTGKTYRSARLIVELIKKGKKIGICSNSHKAIENVLEAVGKAAKETEFDFRAAKFKTDNSGTLPEFSNNNIALIKTENKILKELPKLDLIGATAWFFARHDVKNQFDYIFVDEAGQVCLANIVAIAPATKNIVLIGDQLQLEQPVKGSHPGESGLSSLEYLLGDKSTINPNQGVFLSTSRRMHPDLCELVSTAVYDGRLRADEVTASRQLIPASGQAEDLPKLSGLIYLPVEHEGNSQHSIEEAKVIESLTLNLLELNIRLGEKTRPLNWNDILIVAPYNQQVRLLQSKLPKARVGSVDKFQGSEAPIVIVSMSASDLASSTRGAEFLLSKKRLNVAISRAQLLAIVVGSPALSQFACSTVEQAALLNLYCRFMFDGKISPEEILACTTAKSC